MSYVYGEEVSYRYPDVSIRLEEITPEIAAQMLEHNTHNRNINRQSAVRVALASNEFVLTSDAIAFDKNGVLLNGQHRLNECVRLGKPIDVIVIRGLDADSQMAMDVGRKRSLSDYVAMDGYPSARTVATIASALLTKKYFGLEQCFIENNTLRNKAYTIKRQHTWIIENYENEIKPILSDVRHMVQRFKGVSAKTWAVLFDEFRKIDNEAYAHFVDMMYGECVPDENIHKLREVLIKNANSQKQKLSQKHIAALIVKTWNAYMKGETLEFLRFSPGGAHPEKFPEIFRGWRL